jgi:hypothetical protein
MRRQNNACFSPRQYAARFVFLQLYRSHTGSIASYNEVSQNHSFAEIQEQALHLLCQSHCVGPFSKLQNPEKKLLTTVNN